MIPIFLAKNMGESDKLPKIPDLSIVATAYADLVAFKSHSMLVTEHLFTQTILGLANELAQKYLENRMDEYPYKYIPEIHFNYDIQFARYCLQSFLRLDRSVLTKLSVPHSFGKTGRTWHWCREIFHRAVFLNTPAYSLICNWDSSQSSQVGLNVTLGDLSDGYLVKNNTNYTYDVIGASLGHRKDEIKNVIVRELYRFLLVLFSPLMTVIFKGVAESSNIVGSTSRDPYINYVAAFDVTQFSIWGKRIIYPFMALAPVAGCNNYPSFDGEKTANFRDTLDIFVDPVSTSILAGAFDFSDLRNSASSYCSLPHNDWHTIKVTRKDLLSCLAFDFEA